MKSLIVEDDFTSRILIQRFLAPYGESHVAINGVEAVAAFSMALFSDSPYDLICLDIMMPEMDGHTTLRDIRAIEESKGIMLGDGVKVIMATSLDNMEDKVAAFQGACDAYLVKPISKGKLIELLQSLALID